MSKHVPRKYVEEAIINLPVAQDAMIPDQDKC